MTQQKNTVLIVEDSTAFSDALQEVFHSNYSYEVIVANDFAQTQLLYEQHKDSIFAAVTDLVLPDAESGAAVQFLRKYDIPCVAFTGDFSPTLRTNIFKWGASDYVLKKGQKDIDYVVAAIHRLHENMKLKVLIVDDAASSRAYLSDILFKQAFQVDTASSAKEALDLIRNGYDARIVLIDLVMDNIDGLELLNTLRLEYDASQMAIIGISGLASSDQIAKFMKYGGNDFLMKPFEHEQVVCRVNSLALLHEQFDRLTALNAQKNDLLGMAAHDIRGPLGVVTSCGQMLQTEVKSDQGTKMLNLLIEATQNMEELLNSLLDISAIEHATIKFSPEKINLSQMCDSLVSEMQLIAENKSQTLLLNKSMNDVCIHADSARIQDVIRNLISNAIKYSPIGKSIEISISFNQKKVRIQVIDEAGGIPEDERHLLFQPFAKISTKTTAGERSTGLGLAICKRIIDQHHGSISYSENKPQGSIFEVVLPII
ncbi:MAG: response regulator [Oleiphilus sp.]